MFVFEFGKCGGALPADCFCVRKPAAVFAGGCYWIYADVVPWTHRYWPDTYDTSIHAFSSADCRAWKYHGEVIKHRAKGAWDFGGTATPGAVVWNGKILIFYSGREFADGKGKRQIGMAVADFPSGPFVKLPEPVICSDHPDSHLDDPIPVISSDGEFIRLYYRQADHFKPPIGNYLIRMRESSDGGKSWSEPYDILRTGENSLRALETAEVAVIDGKTCLFTFDHFFDGTFQTVLRVSQNGIDFPCKGEPLDEYFSSRFKRPDRGGGFQIVLIPEKNGSFKHIGVSNEIDAEEHYNLYISELILKNTPLFS